MQVKTKDELRAELDFKNSCLDYTHKLCVQGLQAVAKASKSVCCERSDQFTPHEIAAFFTTVFYAELQRLTGMNSVEIADAFLLDSGFDECTATVIKQLIPEYLEIFKLGREGLSDQEIIEFRRKRKEAESGG